MNKKDLIKEVRDIGMRFSGMDNTECPEIKLVSGTLFALAAALIGTDDEIRSFAMAVAEINEKLAASTKKKLTARVLKKAGMPEKEKTNRVLEGFTKLATLHREAAGLHLEQEEKYLKCRELYSRKEPPSDEVWEMSQRFKREAIRISEELIQVLNENQELLQD